MIEMVYFGYFVQSRLGELFLRNLALFNRTMTVYWMQFDDGGDDLSTVEVS